MARAETTTEEQKMIDEWLKKNKVTICPPMTRTDPDDVVNVWKKGRGRKKKDTKSD
tara:strand:+ start:687 stop:854 length:168 start_codon:yes stop_codon:yes gene_type:complete